MILKDSENHVELKWKVFPSIFFFSSSLPDFRGCCIPLKISFVDKRIKSLVVEGSEKNISIRLFVIIIRVSGFIFVVLLVLLRFFFFLSYITLGIWRVAVLFNNSRPLAIIACDV